MPAGKPNGVVITIHGGGWVHTGADMLALENKPAAIYRRAGWAVLNVDYRPGRDSITDVVSFYDQARKATGPSTPICASGQSAGGHLALLLAVQRPRLACAITEAGPATLTPIMAGGSSPETAAAARSVFSGPGGAALSPALGLRGYNGRVLAAYSTGDTVIPAGPQVAALRRLGIHSTLMPGAACQPTSSPATVWVHVCSTASAIHSWEHQQTRFLRTVA